MMGVTSQENGACALVVGGGLNALGVVRSLGRAGVPVWVMDTAATSSAMRSRYARPCLVPSLEGGEFMDSLSSLASRLGGRAVLFITEEKTVATVSALRQRLPASVSVQLPEHTRLMALMHKQGFQELAEAVGAPVPRTVRLQGLADLPAVSLLQYPCVLKPSEKNYAYGERFKKAYKVSSADEVADLYREIEPIMADMVVQEWIEGGDHDIYFCMQYISANGAVVASFPGRKIRSWPPRIGGTASCTAAWPHAQELQDITARFFRQVGFVGMGSMEYKRDTRDGCFRMVEPTVGRTDFQEEVATLNGCNLPLMAYCHELGLPLPVVQPHQPARVWRESQIDRWSRQEQAGQEAVDAALADHQIFDAYRRWDDPTPWLDHVRQRLAQRLKR
jgi:D-aspartate ligase